MATFQIDKIGKTKTGNLSITAVDGTKYYAKAATGLDGKAGATIEAETSVQQMDNGTLTWINKWKMAAEQPPRQDAAPAGQPAPQGRFTPNGTNLDLMPFTSNCVANAIRAGHIDAPEKIEAWTLAAYRAAIALGRIEPY